MNEHKEHIRQLAIDKFTDHLDKILVLWDEREFVEVVIKMDIKPLIDISIGDSRVYISTEKLRALLKIAASQDNIVKVIKKVKEALKT